MALPQRCTSSCTTGDLWGPFLTLLGIIFIMLYYVQKTPPSAPRMHQEWGWKEKVKMKETPRMRPHFILRIFLIIKKQFKINIYTQKCYISTFNMIEATDVFIFAGRWAPFSVDWNKTSPATSARNRNPSTYVWVRSWDNSFSSPKWPYTGNKHGQITFMRETETLTTLVLTLMASLQSFKNLSKYAWIVIFISVIIRHCSCIK